MPTEDRRVGKLLPSPVTPADTVCFMIQIPNAVAYRAAFLGQINILGQALTWDHPRDGTECAPCEEAAQLWRNAIYNASWSDECETSMSCDDVADCIDTSEAVQDKIKALASEVNPTPQETWEDARYGPQMTDAQGAQTFIKGEACDYGSLFGSVTAIVDQMHTNNIDFLQRLEVQTNFSERVQELLSAIPVFETLPFDDIVGFANTLQDQILENYESVYTTALRDEYRCDIFCLTKDLPDCEMSFDALIEYYEDRLGASFSNEQLFTDMVTFLTIGTWSGTQIVDVLTLAQLAIWRWTSSWLSLSIKTFQMVGLLGANDNDPDWEILCEECAPIPTENCASFIGSEGGFTAWKNAFNLAAATHTAQGWDTGYNAGFAAIIKTITGTITGVTIRLAEPTPLTTNVLIQVGNLNATGTTNNTAKGQDEYIFTNLSITGGLYVNVQTDAAWTSGQKIIEVCWELAP